MADNGSVEVALKIRPLIDSEVSKGCQDILEVYPERDQVRVKNSDKAFTYNYVLSPSASHDNLYSRCIQRLIDNIFKGYNVTVLAYGQTGSGKTYCMGTTYSGEGDMGVIPRSAYEIFEHIRKDSSYNFTLSVSFLELYQETVYDLLSSKPRDQSTLEIREDSSKGIIIQGLTEIPVHGAEEVLKLLMKGSTGRATGSTNMNAQSSRSHAIFTINISMQHKENTSDRRNARFNLVDLAGSERSKKTGAIGLTFKEGITINKGLLVLGNVISALGDEKQQQGFIPYRDSNLTRLLKDSLGGNSITLMIACVSPADYNFDETLSTLRYADRARKIKNKPIVNQDADKAEILGLKRTIEQLRLQIVNQGGCFVNPIEVESLKEENKNLKQKITDLTFQLSNVLNDNTRLLEEVLLFRQMNDVICKKINEFKGDADFSFEFDANTANAHEIREKWVELVRIIREHFNTLETEQEKSKKEVIQHESLHATRLLNSSFDNEAPTEEVHEEQATFTVKLLDMKNELEEIDRNLALKEFLARQIQSNKDYMVDYLDMAKNEQQIVSLTKEKDELCRQLMDAHMKDSTNNKVAVKENKRIQNLEKQISDLKAKVQEQTRLIKLREKDEMKVRKLNSEIIQMKQDKVRLIRNMRFESEQFRYYKLQKQQELTRLKREDQKKQIQLVKLEEKHMKQQNVLKRKIEQTVAVNKRLKDALDSRKRAQELKLGNSKIEKINHWASQEIAVYLSMIEANAALSDLLEDRALLKHQLDELRNRPLLANSEPIKSLEEEIEYRSVQIQDLQQKLIDFTDEKKVKTRWDNIQSMGEAKVVLQSLWDTLGEVKKCELSAVKTMEDLKESESMLQTKVTSLENDKKQLEQKYAFKIDILEKEYEEQVGIFLKQLNEMTTELANELVMQEVTTHKQKLCEQSEHIRKLEQGNIDLARSNESLKKEIEESKNKIKELTNQMLNNGSRYTLDQELNVTLIKTRRPKHQGVKSLFNKPLEDNELNYSTDYELVVDSDGDQDWKKTPLGKRLVEQREQMRLSNLSSSKRSYPGCECDQEDCSENCSCKIISKKCSRYCKCVDECANRCAEGTGEPDLPDRVAIVADRPRRRRGIFPEPRSKREKKLEINEDSF